MRYLAHEFVFIRPVADPSQICFNELRLVIKLGEETLRFPQIRWQFVGHSVFPSSSRVAVRHRPFRCSAIHGATEIDAFVSLMPIMARRWATNISTRAMLFRTWRV